LLDTHVSISKSEKAVPLIPIHTPENHLFSLFTIMSTSRFTQTILPLQRTIVAPNAVMVKPLRKPQIWTSGLWES